MSKVWNRTRGENPNDDIIKRVHPIKRCSLQIISSHPEPECRFMYDRMENKVLLIMLQLYNSQFFPFACPYYFFLFV